MKPGWLLAQINQTRCGDISDQYIQELCSGNLIASTEFFWDALGPLYPVMMLLIFMPGMYLLSGDLAIPVVVIMFIGVIMSSFLPGIFAFLGVFVTAVAIGIGIFSAIHRLRRES